MFLLSITLTVLFILIGVAFLTLMESKVLSYSQIRKGPNKVGIIGLLHSISDAITLFCKEHTIPMVSNYMIYISTPMMGLMNSLLIWSIFLFTSMFLKSKWKFGNREKNRTQFFKESRRFSISSVQKTQN